MRVRVDLRIAENLPLRIGVTSQQVIGGAEIGVNSIIIGEFVCQRLKNSYRFGWLTQTQIRTRQVIPPGGIVLFGFFFEFQNAGPQPFCIGFFSFGMKDGLRQSRMLALFLRKCLRIPDTSLRRAREECHSCPNGSSHGETLRAETPSSFTSSGRHNDEILRGTGVRTQATFRQSLTKRGSLATVPVAMA